MSEATALPYDLSVEHRPIGDLFAQPTTPEEWAAYRLSAEQVAFFEHHGYLSGIRILSDAQVDALSDELDQLVDPGHTLNHLFYEYHSNEAIDPGQVLFHALGAWRIGRAFHDLLWAPAFRMAAFQLLGGPFRQFHDQLFCRPAGHGGVVAWHQDFSYWTWTRPMAHLSCWIGLDDATTENGCLWYVPGSQCWGLLPVTGLTGDMDAVRTVLDPAQIAAFERRVPNRLKRGEASFHHPLMMHGSYENKSDRQRRATVINVLGDGVRSNVDAMADTMGFEVPPQDAPMAGQFYPLLFDPARELGAAAADVPTASQD